MNEGERKKTRNTYIERLTKKIRREKETKKRDINNERENERD